MSERERFDHRTLEPKWQAHWEREKTFRAERHQGRPKAYVLDMFPYPSGAGLHVGHPEGYTASDIVARYRRMCGWDVLHPMGWDAFGLPAEQHAIKTGTHPAATTRENIANFRRQLKSLGLSYDWDREIDTTDPAYVRWTQWIFLKLFERGLAYQSEIPVNWCPALGTVLANEEVIDGKSEVGGFPVVRQPLRQWLLRITQYADRLLADLDGLDWPDTKAKQTHWIGRSEGAEIDFAVQGDASATIRVFTTRPDTLFGVTYVVLAPEHPLVRLATPAHRDAVDRYIAAARTKSDLSRSETKDKTGVPTGAFAVHPLTGAAVPIWVGDYVLGTYGTGAVMAVPAHDERDFAFAKKYALPIVEVVSPDGKLHEGLSEAFVDDGVLVRSPGFDGLPSAEARGKIIDALVSASRGERRVNYKLRDWVFSRQRYWGEPIPVYFPVELDDASDDPRKSAASATPRFRIRYDQPIAVSESELPVRLPDLEDFRPGNDPAGALAKAVDWRFFQRDGKWFARETNTMPQWAGSCWYYLRYLDPKNDARIFDPAAYDAWMPVDLYVGGNEHAVLHLLYARFWHKALFDLGIVKHAEPFTKLVHQGMILGEVEHTAFKAPAGAWVSAEDVTASTEDESGYVRKSDGAAVTAVKVAEEQLEKRGARVELKDAPGIAVDSRSHKMSKSRGNVVNPDAIVEEFGADTLRVYEMFMGPLEQTKPWQTSAISGVRRFLDRIWTAATAESFGEYDDATKRLVHKTIKKVTHDIETMRFNTAVSTLMVLARELAEKKAPPREAIEALVLLVSPLAPHVAEELWQRLGHTQSLAYHAWPTWDEALTKDDVVEIAVQVNGKVRGRITLAAAADEAAARSLAEADPNVQQHLTGKQVKKFIYVPGKIANLIVG